MKGLARLLACSRRGGRSARWLRLGLGVAGLAAFFWWLTTAPMPPGRAADVIRRNLRQDVQADALFYVDLEAMPAIEKGSMVVSGNTVVNGSRRAR